MVNDLDLKPIGMGGLISASGKTRRKKFLFSVGLPLVAVDPAGKSSGVLQFFGPSIEGLEVDAGGTNFDVILGMDIIMRGSLKLDFDGHFSFCF